MPSKPTQVVTGSPQDSLQLKQVSPVSARLGKIEIKPTSLVWEVQRLESVVGSSPSSSKAPFLAKKYDEYLSLNYPRFFKVALNS